MIISYEILTTTISHSTAELNNFSTIFSQYDFRKELIIKALQENSINLSALDTGKLTAYLQTNDARNIEEIIDKGHKKAEFIYKAMGYCLPEGWLIVKSWLPSSKNIYTLSVMYIFSLAKMKWKLW